MIEKILNQAYENILAFLRAKITLDEEDKKKINSLLMEAKERLMKDIQKREEIIAELNYKLRKLLIENYEEFRRKLKEIVEGEPFRVGLNFEAAKRILTNPDPKAPEITVVDTIELVMIENKLGEKEIKEIYGSKEEEEKKKNC